MKNRDNWREQSNPSNYDLTSENIRWLFLVILSVIAIISALYATSQDELSLGLFAANISTNFVGVIITIIALDIIISNKQRDENNAQLTKVLGALIRNKSGIVAITAVDLLREYDFLGYGNFEGFDFSDTNLEGARFSHIIKSEIVKSGITHNHQYQINYDIYHRMRLNRALFENSNLDNTSFERCDLNGANFYKASLKNADLRSSNCKEISGVWADFSDSEISKAVFSDAHLQFARFNGTKAFQTDFSGSNLAHVNFSGAMLNSATFFGANLYHVTLDENTILTDVILPDGTIWNSDVDMSKFISTDVFLGK